MPLPGVTQTIINGGLGLVAPGGDKTVIKIGVCSSSTANTLNFYTNPDTMKAACGVGPLVDSASYHLQNAGGTVGVMRCAASTAGSAGAVSVSRGGAGDSTATCTVAGAPYDAYQVKIKITKQGANLAAVTAEFQYSLDNGDNYSDVIAMPASGIYAIPNTNLTVTFVDGIGTAFKVDDIHSFTCVAPAFTLSDLSTALDALKARTDAAFFCIHIVGHAASSAGQGAIMAAVQTKLTTEEAGYRYVFAVMEWPDESDATIIAAAASITAERIMSVGGFVELVSDKRQMKRHAAWPMVVRLAQQKPQRDLGRTRGDSEGGALPGIVSLYRDEASTPALDAARISTLRTHPGQAGFYATHGKMLHSLNSDYTYVQHRRVMDIACAVNYQALFPFLNSDDFDYEVKVVNNATIAVVDELSARSMEATINAQLKARMVLTSPPMCKDAQSVVTRDNDVVSTMTLRTKVRVQPKPYAKFIETEIGFSKAALVAS